MKAGMIANVDYNTQTRINRNSPGFPPGLKVKITSNYAAAGPIQQFQFPPSTLL
jgi:hypothetical protein